MWYHIFFFSVDSEGMKILSSRGSTRIPAWTEEGETTISRRDSIGGYAGSVAWTESTAYSTSRFDFRSV